MSEEYPTQYRVCIDDLSVHDENDALCSYERVLVMKKDYDALDKQNKALTILRQSDDVVIRQLEAENKRIGSELESLGQYLVERGDWYKCQRCGRYKAEDDFIEDCSGNLGIWNETTGDAETCCACVAVEGSM